MVKRITCRVTPNARKTAVGEFEEDPRYGKLLRVRIQSPPSDGKANKELILTLAKHFGVKRREISIVSGQKSRLKVVEIETGA